MNPRPNRWLRHRSTWRRVPDDDGGTAIIEFIFVGLIMLVPLVYLIAAVSVIQRSELAVSQAAREAGRAFATSDTPSQAQRRARTAVELALGDQGLPDDARLRFVRAGANCDASSVSPRLAPGEVFTVCVSRHTQLPGVPSILSGHRILTIGEYVVHVDDYRDPG